MVPKVVPLRGIVSYQAQVGKLRGQLRAGVSERLAIKGGYLARKRVYQRQQRREEVPCGPWPKSGICEHFNLCPMCYHPDRHV